VPQTAYSAYKSVALSARPPGPGGTPAHARIVTHANSPTPSQGRMSDAAAGAPAPAPDNAAPPAGEQPVAAGGAGHAAAAGPGPDCPAAAGDGGGEPGQEDDLDHAMDDECEDEYEDEYEGGYADEEEDEGAWLEGEEAGARGTRHEWGGGGGGAQGSRLRRACGRAARLGTRVRARHAAAHAEPDALAARPRRVLRSHLLCRRGRGGR